LETQADQVFKKMKNQKARERAISQEAMPCNGPPSLSLSLSFSSLSSFLLHSLIKLKKNEGESLKRHLKLVSGGGGGHGYDGGGGCVDH
jgi:hypothetical protein